MKPNERDPAVDRLMRGLEPPHPPPDLRSKALAAARVRMSAEPIPDIWSRVWNHRGFRLAWAAAVILLLAGHVLVVPGNGVDIDLMAENRVDEQFADLLQPTRISENARPIVGLFALAGDPSEPEVKGNPS